MFNLTLSGSYPMFKPRVEVPQLQTSHSGDCLVYISPPSHTHTCPRIPSWVPWYSLMIFTSLVKNKLASLLALTQSGRSTGNHQPGEEGNRKFTLPEFKIDGGEMKGGSAKMAPGGRGGATAQVVISKLVK